MKYVVVLFVLFVDLTAAFGSQKYTLDIEACFPGNKTGRDDATIGMITSDSMSRNIKLEPKEKKTPDGYKVFGAIESVWNDRWRRVTVELGQEAPGLLVYDLAIPRNPAEKGWSQWFKPIFKQTGDYPDFRIKKQQKQGQLPPSTDAPLLRYRIVNDPDYWDYRYGRKKDIERPIPGCKCP